MMQWTFWIIQEPGTSPVKLFHPVHLHGHDFWVLGSGLGIFDPKANATTLKFANPPRRDVAFLPSGGWIVLAFPADNPGAWLMHCHIGSHVAAGLGTQFLESKSLIKAPDAAWSTTCANWSKYYARSIFKETDSGLKAKARLF
jgi:Multicopper oxidase